MNNLESITKEEVVEDLKHYYLKFNIFDNNVDCKWLIWIPITKAIYNEINFYIDRYSDKTGHSTVISDKEIDMFGNYCNSDIKESLLQYPITITEAIQKDIMLPLSSDRKPVGEAPIEESDYQYKLRIFDTINTITINETYYSNNPYELSLLLKSLTIKKLI